MHVQDPPLETATIQEGMGQTTQTVPVKAYPGEHERQVKVFDNDT